MNTMNFVVGTETDKYEFGYKLSNEWGLFKTAQSHISGRYYPFYINFIFAACPYLILSRILYFQSGGIISMGESEYSAK